MRRYFIDDYELSLFIKNADKKKKGLLASRIKTIVRKGGKHPSKSTVAKYLDLGVMNGSITIVRLNPKKFTWNKVKRYVISE